MADIIHLDEKRNAPEDNLIVDKPLEMRWGDWHSGVPMQVFRREAQRFEQHRQAVHRKDHFHISQVPSHFALKDGSDTTLWALFRWRHDADRMHDVYFLAGLMECVTLVPHPVLRSMVIRSYYRRIQELQEELGVRWRGRNCRFLLPMAPVHKNENDFAHNLQKADTLKQLFDAIREETFEQLLILGDEYVFYFPRIGQA